MSEDVEKVHIRTLCINGKYYYIYFNNEYQWGGTDTGRFYERLVKSGKQVPPVRGTEYLEWHGERTEHGYPQEDPEGFEYDQMNDEEWKRLKGLC